MNNNFSSKKNFTFSNIEKVNNIISQYPDKKSATLPLLHLAQSENGYISDAVINTVSDFVDCHPAVVMDCVSFYTMFYTKPQGRHIIQICQTLSCSLNGADALVDEVRDKYDIKPGETTEDGRFTLIKVECLGSCGTAPVAQINNEYHEELSQKKLNDLLDCHK